MNDAQIPITETGYRSHFLPDGIVEDHGGPEAYVLALLDHEADSDAWKNVKRARVRCRSFRGHPASGVSSRVVGAGHLFHYRRRFLIYYYRSNTYADLFL